MPEEIAVSPLLDGFTIGTPLNDHYGVRCYPAVKEDSDRKYIIKIISVPPSQTQLEALLITGAYQDSAQAGQYYRQLSDQLVEEAQLLHRLSRLSGFVPFEGCQVEPMQKNRIGYQVYLLSGFRLSLERYMHRHTVSHLEAVNLGIDLCAALSACRDEGMLYIDLKPSNIFISNKKEYKIGDLGFVPMDSMKYSSMPERYRSCYTPPELLDDLSVLNGTVDTYALGMILYQIFNNGALPQDLTKPLPAPAVADQEMTGILQKACAPNPADRWETPSQMGQALIDYMQRGTINDVPIMEPITAITQGEGGEGGYQTTKFPVPEMAAQEAAEEEVSEQPQEQIPQELQEQAPSQPEAEEEQPQAEQEQPQTEPEQAPDVEAEEAPPAEPEAAEESEPAADEEPRFAEIPEEPPLEFSAAEIEAAAAEEFSRLTGEEPLQPEPPQQTIDSDQLDQELKKMNQLLRASEKPAPRVTKPQPHVEPVVIKPVKRKRSAVSVLLTIFFLCLVLAVSVWGYMYYRTEYLQTVNGITIQEDYGKLTVQVDSAVQEGLLSVVCTDPYGNSFTQSVRGGVAEFNKLTPGTFYTIQVQVSGLHKLTQPISEVYTTEGTTNLAAFNARMGDRDGSVALSMIVEGHEPDQWQVFYSAEGEPELAKTFTGHNVTLENLTIGKLYSFRMELMNDGVRSEAGGQNTVQFTPSHVIGVRALTVVSCLDGAMTVQWDSTSDLQPEFWWVRCVGENYDETQEVTQMQAVFTGISSSCPYTVEVCAKGMDQISRTTVSANPITLTDLRIDDSDPQELRLSWQCEGAAPEGGWMVMYTLDSSDLPSVVKAEGTTAVVAPRIPGAVYHFTFQADGDVTVFNGAQTYHCPAAQVYTGHQNSGDNITCRLLVTPDNSDWNYTAISSNSTNQSFPLGQPLSAVLQSTYGNFLEDDVINILYVFRDTTRGASAEMIGEESRNWHDLWNGNDSHYAELNLPVAPSKPGSYVLDIYFNGYALASANLTIY